jgi:hypothetical protein
MSTLEIACSRCDKRFRVRAEFAGRSTRCPGCSAPISIAGAAPSPPPKPISEEPRPRPRRRDDDEEEPRRPAADWGPVEAAFRREQWAVIFVFIGLLGGLFSYCVANVTRQLGETEPAVIFFVLLFGIGPPITTAAFGLMARAAALSAPKDSLARGSAKASMVCAIAGIICLLMFALGMLNNIGSYNPDPLPLIIGLGGVILCGLGAFATFFGFVAQVGIARGSPAVSRGIAHTTVAIAASLIGVLVIGLLYTLFSTMDGGGYRYSHEHEGFFMFILGILFPLALGVVLILYHRVLAAGRRAVLREESRRFED